MRGVYVLKEDQRLDKLPVRFSTDILNRIKNIENYNKSNLESVEEWHKYIEAMESHISNPVIAWDNTNKYYHCRNKAIHLQELGYDVMFIVQTDRRTQTNYVYVFKANLKPEEFGLKVPQSLHEEKNVIRISESLFLSIIQEEVLKFLIENKKPAPPSHDITTGYRCRPNYY